MNTIERRQNHNMKKDTVKEILKLGVAALDGHRDDSKVQLFFGLINSMGDDEIFSLDAEEILEYIMTKIKWKNTADAESADFIAFKQYVKKIIDMLLEERSKA